MHLNLLEKQEQINVQIGRFKEIIKTRTNINGLETLKNDIISKMKKIVLQEDKSN
jgi:hypothetical protein